MFLSSFAISVGASSAFALDGQVGIHDPSTIILCEGKFYTYGTGGNALVSDDGWTWRRGTTLPRRGLAPDVIHLGDRYYVYVAANIGAQPKAAVNMIWTKTLDPDSPDYKWEEGGVVASSDGVEDSNAIDPGVFRDPNDGRLWLVYGSYFGYIRLVELDPKTGKRLNPNDQPRNIAINSEASDMIYHDGWYYLLVTHGSCCRGADSGYNIRVGRARKVGGPFLDNDGVDMIQGGGKLLIGSGGRVVGPGHFGLIDLGDGVQKFSLHWEADLDRGGASVLDIRPLLWKDGWPVAGENAKPGVYEIESVRTGTALEMAVEGMPVGGRRARGGRGFEGQAGADSTAERRGRFEELASRQHRYPHGQLYASSAANVVDRTGPQRRGLSGFAVFQDHHRRHGSRAGGDGRRRTGSGAVLHRRARAALASRPVSGRLLAHHAKVGPQFQTTVRSLRDRRQFRHPVQVRSQEREATLAAKDSMNLSIPQSF